VPVGDDYGQRRAALGDHVVPEPGSGAASALALAIARTSRCAPASFSAARSAGSVA